MVSDHGIRLTKTQREMLSDIVERDVTITLMCQSEIDDFTRRHPPWIVVAGAMITLSNVESIPTDPQPDQPIIISAQP